MQHPLGSPRNDGVISAKLWCKLVLSLGNYLGGVSMPVILFLLSRSGCAASAARRPAKRVEPSTLVEGQQAPT